MFFPVPRFAGTALASSTSTSATMSDALKCGAFHFRWERLSRAQGCFYSLRLETLRSVRGS